VDLDLFFTINIYPEIIFSIKAERTIGVSTGTLEVDARTKISVCTQTYFVSHEIQFQDGQTGFGQCWPECVERIKSDDLLMRILLTASGIL
jgi:hypothetical protein